MLTNTKTAKTPENFISSLYKKIPSNDKFSFFCGFLICLAVNMFVYTNTCFVHDSIMLYNDSSGIANGRLLVGPLFALLNRMQIPWVIGLLTCFFMGFVIVYLAKIFNIKSKVSTILLAGIVVTSDTIVVSHVYFGSVYIFVLSLLLAVMAVYYTDKYKYGYIIAVILLCLSMFMYQAYVATAVCLFIYKLIIDLIENLDSKFITRLKQIAKYVIITVISTAVYYAIWKFSFKLIDYQTINYYAYSGIEEKTTASDLMTRVLNTVINTLFQLFPYYGISNVYYLKYIVSTLTVIAFIVFAIKQKNMLSIILYFVYSLMFLFSVNLMYFLSGRVSYELTIFSYILPMISMLYIIDNKIISKTELQYRFNWVVCVLSIVLIAGQTVYANSVYLKLKTNYDNAWSYATRLVDRLEQTEGFNKDTKVKIISHDYKSERCTYKVTEYKRNNEIQRATNYTSGYKNNTTLYSLMNGITYPETLCWFITQEMDMDIEITGNSQEMIDNPEVKNMGVFPSTNSVKLIGDTLVVKIG